MKYLQYLVRIGLHIIGIVILLFTIKIISIADVVDEKLLYLLHNMMKGVVILPALGLGLISIIGLFITKEKSSWCNHIFDNKKGWSFTTAMSFIIVIGLQFYRYGLGVFLSATSL